MSTGSTTAVLDMGARVNSPVDKASAAPADMEKRLAKLKAKLLHTPNKDLKAAKSYSKILEEHKSRSRGKWGELGGARAGCCTEALHQGKILPAKVLVIPAMEIQQSLLAGGY